MNALNYLTLTGKNTPLRVAAYCRISFEEGISSFQNQKSFFEKAIKEHPNWLLEGIYGDYAKSGTMLKGRNDFKRMMKRAEAGKIDYIITKSISRFSRSAVDTLFSIRKLSSLGVGVYFLEQGLDTKNNYGDLVLTALASIAEMESESISKNTKTTFDAMNKKGDPLQKARYGYRKDGLQWQVNPKEAIRVKLAYLMAANGFLFKDIADRLNQLEHIDRTDRIWTGKIVKELLLAEAYVGDLLTNKSVMVWEKDGKKQVENNGIVDKYYISYHHAPLVGRTLFEELCRLIKAKKLPGQSRTKDLSVVAETTKMAKRDRLLDDVRKLMPRRGSQCRYN